MIMPVDIENKVFKKGRLGGYDINDVEAFLETLIIDYEKLYKDNVSLKERLTRSEEKVSKYVTLESGINKSVEDSQKAASDILENAYKEAEEIRDKEIEKVKIDLENLKLDKKSKELEFEQLKKQMDIYKIKLKSMLESQIQILDDEL